MSAKKVPYLCGGVLFTLLKQAAPPSISSQEKLNGVSDCRSAPKMMVDYINALKLNNTIKEKSPSSKVVSKYINCDENVTKALPFANRLFVSCYDDMVKTQYVKATKKMYEFVLLHLDPNYCRWLVKAILYIIEMDTDIKDSDQFFISPDGMPKTKADIRYMDQFYLPAVLVGVMHYILLYRRNNKAGADTLKEWGSKEDYCERDYNIDAHICFDREIEAIFGCPQSTEDTSIQKSETIKEESNKEVQILRETTSSKIYAKIFSLERKIMEHLQPTCTSTKGIARLFGPIESDPITDQTNAMSEPDLE